MVLEKLLALKYNYRGSLVISIIIDNHFVKNTLIDIGVTINMITITTMERLGLTSFHSIHITLQMTDGTTMKSIEILKGIILKIDSWEYPIHFRVL